MAGPPKPTYNPSALRGPEGNTVRGDHTYDLKALMKEFGLTEAQVRYRLLKLEPVFAKAGYTPKRGKDNRILLCNQGLAFFRRFVELEREGRLVKDVVRVLLSEMPKEALSYRELQAYKEQIEELKRQLEDARQERTFLKEEIAFLRGQNEDLRRQNEDLREMLRRLMEKAASGASGAEPPKEEPPTA